MFTSLFVVILGLCFCCKESNQIDLEAPKLTGPSEAMLKGVVEFTCELPYHPMNESILLELFHKSDGHKLGEYTSLMGKPGVIPLVVKLGYEGDIECAARPQNRSYIEPVFSKTHHLRVIEPVKGAEIAIRSGLQEFLEGNRLELFCKLTAGNHVSYKWLLNGQPISQAQSSQLLINRTTSEDSGRYRCEASNKFNGTVFTSNSSEVEITVNDVVSTPTISFTVLKESHNYFAIVTCQSTRGTPPVTFSLYNREELVTNVTSEDRSAIFQVPVVLDQHMGCLQCQANNGNHTAYSRWLPLEVVSVGGPLTVHYDTDIGENYAVIGVRFYCKAAKGSHLQYDWFLNNTLLQKKGSFYRVEGQAPEQSVLLLAVGRESAGTYHCEVANNFDITTAISSKRTYIDKEELNRLPVLVVAIVFGSFTFLILMVAVCCGVGVMARRRRYGEKSLPELEMEKMIVAYEGELDKCEYNEDTDMRTATGDELDQASEASVDEWPQIVEQEKTLEDEPIEL